MVINNDLEDFEYDRWTTMELRAYGSRLFWWGLFAGCISASVFWYILLSGLQHI